MKISIKSLSIILVLVAVFGIIYFLKFGNNTKLINKQDSILTSKEDKFSIKEFKTDDNNDGEEISFIKFKGVKTLNEIRANKDSVLEIISDFTLSRGEIDWGLVDSDYNVVNSINNESKESRKFKIEKNRTYFLRIYSKNAEGGKGKIKINSNDEVEVIHKETFWD
ncbi:hypothetical protein CLPU_15c00460 [Gottschalkia purinilytica]|uniref:Uncharacterized protein n=1 Tax=Gottschalkia purinilytica TaxID=1503 RepID=A0A0L0W7Z2_GOTPU|nr:hypothetical protein [Gottschalkia purinilytica]KNF07552.1 hypothetical protein CLPU_15c00460 [Gottschalkia purinilytica]